MIEVGNSVYLSMSKRARTRLVTSQDALQSPFYPLDDDIYSCREEYVSKTLRSSNITLSFSITKVIYQAH